MQLENFGEMQLRCKCSSRAVSFPAHVPLRCQPMHHRPCPQGLAVNRQYGGDELAEWHGHEMAATRSLANRNRNAECAGVVQYIVRAMCVVLDRNAFCRASEGSEVASRSGRHRISASYAQGSKISLSITLYMYSVDNALEARLGRAHGRKDGLVNSRV